MVYVAQREADGISTRVRRQKQQRREMGLPHGGRRPLGWRNLMEPDPVEAAALRDAMEAVVRGASLFDIAARWQVAGFGGPGRIWGGTDVRRILISPRHAGLVVHRGEIVVDKDGKEIRAAWPAIVPRELWEACRSVLAARATGVGTARRRPLLTGLLRCGACGSKMTRSSTKRSRVTWRCWRDKRGCGAVSIGAIPLEAVVTEALFEDVDGEELRAALASRDAGRVQAIRTDLHTSRRGALERRAPAGDHALVEAHVGTEPRGRGAQAPCLIRPHRGTRVWREQRKWCVHEFHSVSGSSGGSQNAPGGGCRGRERVIGLRRSAADPGRSAGCWWPAQRGSDWWAR